jgi:polysaccharide biosynthesis transport protein
VAADGRAVSTLHDYLRVLRRRKWIIIPAIVLAPVAAMLLSSRGPTRYQASAQVLVNRQNLPGELSGVSDPTQFDSTRYLTTQAQVARLPEIALAALKQAGIKNGSASDLLGESVVTSSVNSDFLTFAVSDAAASRAMRLATAYATQYAAYAGAYERSQLESALQSVRGRIARLERTGTAKSPLHSSLVDEANQLAGMEAVAASRVALVRPAKGTARLAPHVVRNGVLGFVLGLMTAVGLAFLRDALDLRARSAEQIGGALHLRLLGRIPRPSRNLRSANRLAMLAEPESPQAESFRMLRTSLEFVISRRLRGPQSKEGGDTVKHLPVQGVRRVMVTSAVEEEGKSTTVANLAVAFARAGRNVILVDLDFRRASLHRFFGLKPQPGLTEVALDSVPLSEALSYVDVGAADRVRLSIGGSSSGGSLRVLPLGAHPAHADEMLLTVALEQVLAQLANEADLLLIDAPPLLRVGDALALTSYVDGLLLVANLRAVRPAMLDELKRVLDDCPAEKLGFILTGADLEGGYEYLTYPYARTLNVG